MRHCWCLVVCRVYPAEVEMGDEQRHRMLVIGERFGKAHCLAGEAAIEQPHAEVGALGVVYGDKGGVRIADLWNAFDPLANYRVFPALAFTDQYAASRGREVFSLRAVVDV